MSTDGPDAYISAFRRTTVHASPLMRLPVVDEPGILGLLGSEAQPNGRLLVTDDRALPLLRSLEDPYAGSVVVLTAAEGCVQHMDSLTDYSPDPVTAMVAADLAAIPSPALPAGLRIQRVTTAPSADEVGLDLAAAACQRADPSSADMSLSDFVAYLKTVPQAVFLAATDETGAVRATAGATILGADADVFFVSTDHSWRGLGTATAMTAAAVHAAAQKGATQVTLNATAAGLGTYLRMGLESVADALMFARRY